MKIIVIFYGVEMGISKVFLIYFYFFLRKPLTFSKKKYIM